MPDFQFHTLLGTTASSYIRIISSSKKNMQILRNITSKRIFKIKPSRSYRMFFCFRMVDIFVDKCFSLTSKISWVMFSTFFVPLLTNPHHRNFEPWKLKMGWNEDGELRTYIIFQESTPFHPKYNIILPRFLYTYMMVCKSWLNLTTVDHNDSPFFQWVGSDA